MCGKKRGAECVDWGQCLEGYPISPLMIEFNEVNKAVFLHYSEVTCLQVGSVRRERPRLGIPAVIVNAAMNTHHPVEATLIYICI